MYFYVQTFSLSENNGISYIELSKKYFNKNLVQKRHYIVQIIFCRLSSRKNFKTNLIFLNEII